MRAAGAQTYLLKPLDFQQFFAEVDESLSGRGAAPVPLLQRGAFISRAARAVRRRNWSGPAERFGGSHRAALLVQGVEIGDSDSHRALRGLTA